jgi:hypothetical protein
MKKGIFSYFIQIGFIKMMLRIELTLSDGTELCASYNGTLETAFNFFYDKETNEKRNEHVIKMVVSSIDK